MPSLEDLTPDLDNATLYNQLITSLGLDNDFSQQDFVTALLEYFNKNNMSDPQLSEAAARKIAEGCMKCLEKNTPVPEA